MGAVAAGLLGLGTLALLLPGPVSMTAWSAAPTGAATERALLSAAGLTVWVLLGWHLLILATALLGRLPGRTGRGSRALLRRLAPWTASRVVAAAVGLTLLSGTSACAAELATGGSDSTGSATGAGQTSIADTGSPQEPPGAAGSGRVITSMSIDWPDSVSAAVASPAVTSPATTSSAVTSPASTSPAAGPPIPAASAPAPAPTSAPTPAPAPAARTGPVDAPSAIPTRVAPVTVRAGDSLWSIAHRFLPADATDVETDIAWRSWYVTNSETIGNDPDLIQPGQLLLPPTSRTG